VLSRLTLISADRIKGGEIVKSRDGESGVRQVSFSWIFGKTDMASQLRKGSMYLAMRITYGLSELRFIEHVIRRESECTFSAASKNQSNGILDLLPRGHL